MLSRREALKAGAAAAIMPFVAGANSIAQATEAAYTSAGKVRDAATEWLSYGGDKASSKYSPIAQMSGGREKIVLMLRHKTTEMQDNGVWIATTEEHHASLRRRLPQMRSIQLFGGKISGWQVLPVDEPDFEAAALRVSELVLKQDPRIGKVPNTRRAATGAKTGQRTNSARSARTVRNGRKKP